MNKSTDTKQAISNYLVDVIQDNLFLLTCILKKIGKMSFQLYI